MTYQFLFGRLAGMRVIFCVAAIGALLASIAGSVRPTLAQESLPSAASWLGHARIGGAELFNEMTDEEIEKSVATLAEQNVSVIEGDSDLSRMLTEKEFEAELGLMRRYAQAAHARGLKVVWYYPALEVLSPKAKQGATSMFKQHPAWVQRGIDGKPNIFYGGRGRVHWVDPGMESAWMSFYSPYADMFIGRIKRIAATGLDGIWLDVPIFNDIGTAWADMSPAATARFKADTKLAAPKSENWNDPVWRRWIAWRYGEISNFLLRVRDAARSVSEDVSIVVETVTLDDAAGTQLGLDGSLHKTASDIIQVWEVDVLSDKTAMRFAKPDDWISLIGMSKFAKGASGIKPSWIFTYGQQPEDALLVLAEAIAAGNHPYETKIPQMTTTVGADYRKRVFGWIKEQDHRLFESQPGAKVALYFSVASRDYLDRAQGTGLYATTQNSDSLWWAKDDINSLYKRTYLADYRGITKWLVQNHVPFDIVVRPDAKELARYDAVIAPSLVALSDAEAAVLDGFVANGGRLALTGPAPASLDQFGGKRAVPALKSLAPRSVAQVATPDATLPKADAIMLTPDLVGKSYLVSNAPAASAAIGKLMAGIAVPLETDAGPAVHVELRRVGNETLLHLINPEHIWDKKAPKLREVGVSFAVPANAKVAGVQVTSPTAPLASDLPFTVAGGRVAFKVPLEVYAMVVVTSAP